jgi:hypothetical protein
MRRNQSLRDFQLTVRLYSAPNTSYTAEDLGSAPHVLAVDTLSLVHDSIQFVREIHNMVHWSCIPKKEFLWYGPSSLVSSLPSHVLVLGAS